MTDNDPLSTRREVITPVTAELGAVGFEDAVEIGRGGFGVVYRCWQPALDRMVAVKVSTAGLDEDNRARFLREQRAMGRLTGQPNIVTVLEVGATESGRPYLVMPYHPLDSLDAWIRKNGPLPMEQVLAVGEKIAGALAVAHRLGIVHRDVKPANILLTEQGEPALTDFGIAHITGGFRTAAGTLTGSPAFTAPEVLEGEAPTAAADVYGLGATLFCALTGHAAFERRSGENVVTQFLRITTQAVPDLRDRGIPDDVAALVATAMSRNGRDRPSAAAFGEAIREVRQRHGYSVDAVARADSTSAGGNRQPSVRQTRPPSMVTDRNGSGNLPLELTSFIGRRHEVSEVKSLLSASRLVTLTGVGGVGKTRLAVRAAMQSRRDFDDGAWLVDLSEVSDPALVVDVVAATLGVRNELGARLLDVLIGFLESREVLLVLDNCEHVVAAVAELADALLRTCSGVRMLATSREPLNIAGEAVLRVSPLTVPDPERESALQGMPRFDAVTLFADRAAAVVPGFHLEEDNKSAVAQICARLDGLPLAIELAAARMRTISPQQILARLTDRYTLLTRGSRTAPSRQQTLRWCIDWSYELCAPAEQRLWARLSVFASSFELDAAEEICGTGLTGGSESEPAVLDALSSLVDKSILIREESSRRVRFRLLETMREYGREKLRESGEYDDLRRRHRAWYRKLVSDADAGWISERQLDWIARLEREQPNMREALECCLSEHTEEAAETGLRMVSELFEFWSLRGLFGEGRFWLDRVLAHPSTQSVADRVNALRVGCQIAAAQADFPSAAAFLAEARVLAERAPSRRLEAEISYADGLRALAAGAAADAAAALERAVDLLDSDGAGSLYTSAVTVLGWAYEVVGDIPRAVEVYRRTIGITEACGETFYRSVALRGLGDAAWQQGDPDLAERSLEEALRLDRRTSSPTITAFGLETLSRIAADRGDAERAAVLMGAAQGMWRMGTEVGTVVLNMWRFHDEYERATRRKLGARGFETALERGGAMGLDAAISYALGEQRTAGKSARSGSAAKLTKREREVAGLVARGLSNKQIATRLVISLRTAQGHVEHILSKLGFTSRAQIAAWVIEEDEQAKS
ncbi:protein kinase domain-containing protein [Nocardia sp. R7R-8]|uniref:protein kinase domain-containing protein n=1 Tax=Nocardia sp. R7R-8 TaxID=3459304 RepID=UPI00403E3082